MLHNIAISVEQAQANTSVWLFILGFLILWIIIVLLASE